jgi:NAD(P)-dependent dehydrogenase (short-subunit alcohol dehydrogenase family)
MPDLSEQTILITGATDGLGRALAVELARGGATLLLHGRDDARGAATLAEVHERTGNDRLRFYRADLAELAQVHALADAVSAEHDRLDVLVSNAGIGTSVPGGGRRQESADGFELRFAVNYLAGFVLTRTLLPLLTANAAHTGAARIVHVSSAGQMPIDFDDVMLTRDYSGVRAYCQSKLAQIMFTFDLAEELAETGVTANALHPATYMPTKIVPHPVSQLEDGVRATARLAAAPEVAAVTGRYFDGTREARAHPRAYDADARARLRELSERLTGLAASRT